MTPSGAVTAGAGVRPVSGADAALAAALAALAAGLALEAVSGAGRVENPFLPVMVVSAAGYGVLGHLVARRHRSHPVARVLQGAAGAGAAAVLTAGYANAALFGPLPDAGSVAALWLSRWLWVPQLLLQTTGLLLAFPDGRLPSPRWRVAAAGAVAGGVALSVVVAMTPFTQSVWQPVPVANPFAVLPDAVTMRLWLVAGTWFALGAGVGTAALLVHYRRTTAAGRGRLLLVLPPAVAVPPALLLSQLGAPGGGAAELVTGILLAVAVVATMLRHGVLDVDVVLNRTLVYGLLAASLVGAYVAVVVLVAAAVGQRTSWLPPAVAAGVTALALQPLLHRLRSGVSRLLYGDRAAPDVVVARVRVAGDGVAGNAASDVLSAAAAELTVALRVPWARIEIEGDVGQAGTVRTAGRARPLVHGGETVGTLTVGVRWDGEGPSPADERALRAVTRQLGSTVHALLLARRLAGARERLVTAREDERRRVRRDLHDGLGPALAGLTLGLEGAEELGRRDPVAAVGLLGELRSQAEQAVGDVRRVVEGLRPPALDDLGLAGAVRAELARLASPRLAVRLDVPAELPDLPAAVEVAALRIVGEAAHNVCRHADAATCCVRLAVEGRWLTVRVEDDGTGIAAGTLPHVGLDSMAERAEEVGGRLEVTTAAGAGTVVAAWLPVGSA